MAKFCTECGKEIQNGVAFCTECGTKAPADPAPSENTTVTEAADVAEEVKEVKTEESPAPEQTSAQQPPKAEPQPQAQPQPQVHTQAPPYQAQPTYAQPNGYGQPAHQPYAQPAYQQPVYQQPQQTYAAPTAPDPTNKVVGTGTYFGLMLLFALPIIGFIACIIMCFAPKNKNIKHFARANLIWAIIGLIIAGLLIGGIYLLSNSLLDYINQATDGQFSGWGDLFGNLGDLEGLTEQFGNGGLEGLPLEGLPIE